MVAKRDKLFKLRVGITENRMEVRIQIICDGFADWSRSCQDELISRLEESSEIDLMSSSEVEAQSAFALHHKIDFLNDPSLYEKTKQDFWVTAVPYFAFDVPDGADAVSVRQFEENQHRDKWHRVVGEVAGAGSFAQLGKYLRSEGWLFRSLEEQLEVRATSLESLKNKILKQIRVLQDKEYESMFGYDQTYKRLGLRTSLAHFLEMMPKKPGRKPLDMRNLDAIRARAFATILGRVNIKLIEANVRATTVKELTETTFRVGFDPKLYGRALDVRWAYKHYFRALNTSESAFLNSLSRGRAWLAQQGL